MRNFLENKIMREDMENIYKAFESWDWLNNKTIFVSGAYGMLASYCVYFLIYLNEKFSEYTVNIAAQGRNHEKMYERFGEYIYKPYFTEINSNICEPICYGEKIDYIIHAASLASPQYYAVDPVGTLLPNSMGTYYLLELARNNKAKGFLFFSSGDVYGKLPYLESNYKESDFGYLDPMNLRSCYGESKRMGETMCKAFSEQYNIPAKCVRIAHTYGPTMDIQNDQRVFSEFVKNVIDGKDIVMKSDGKSTRLFCYISDAAKAFFRILKDGAVGEAYNMCNSDCEASIEELAEILVNLFPDKKIKVVKQSRDKDSVYMESPMVRAPVFSTDKLRSLGWKPEIGLREGFKRTVSSFEYELEGFIYG